MFSFIDVIFLSIVLFFAIMACAKGFIEEICGKVAIILSIFIGFYFCSSLSPFIGKFIKSSTISTILAFILLFIVTFLFVKIIQKILEGVFAKGDIMGSLNRVLGFAFGAFEGILIVSVILILLNAQPWFETNSFMQKSFFEKMLGSFLAKPTEYVRGIFV